LVATKEGFLIPAIPLLAVLAAAPAISAAWAQPVDPAFTSTFRRLSKTAALVTVRPSRDEVSADALGATLKDALRKLGIEILPDDARAPVPRFLIKVTLAAAEPGDMVGYVVDLKLVEPVLVRRGSDERLVWGTTWQADAAGITRRGAPLKAEIEQAVADNIDLLATQYRRTQE
jgi:hypothetical protein